MKLRRASSMLAALLCMSACGVDVPSTPGDDDQDDDVTKLDGGEMRDGSQQDARSDARAMDGSSNADADTSVLGDAGGSGNGAGSFAFPLTLTPLTSPNVATANISLFFSVIDKNGEGVTTLQDAVARAAAAGTVVNCSDSDFIVLEDNKPVDCTESDFRATQLLGKNVKIPTVLVLDLSGSIVASGALQRIKTAALAIVDAMLPEQTLAVVTFADAANVRAPLTSNKDELKRVINAISASDGVSTNLNGAVISALQMWTDGFDPNTEVVTAGVGIVLTDGADSAGSRTLQDVKSARGSKRLITVGVGNNVDKTALTEMQSAGFLNPQTFDELVSSISTLTTKLQTLNRSIYKANYCSPKRMTSTTTTLTFTVKGNLESTTTAGSCKKAEFRSGSYCNSSDALVCQNTGTGSTCCPKEAPYHCAALGKCYTTQAVAAMNCGESCTACGGSGTTTTQTSTRKIEVTFNASNYDSKQCPAFRGMNCSALAACCASPTLPGTYSSSCASAVASGNESQCGSLLPSVQSYCPRPADAGASDASMRDGAL